MRITFPKLSDALSRAVWGIAIATPGGSSLAGPQVNTVLDGMTMRIVDYLSLIAGAVAMIFVIWNGIRYMQAGGDTKKAEEARKGLVAAVIGVVLLVAVRYIIALSVGAGQITAGTVTSPIGF